MGDEGRLVAAAAGYDGVVLEEPSGGHAAAATAEAAGQLARRIPAVMPSGTGSGPVRCRTYGFPRSGRKPFGRGFVPAGLLKAGQSWLVLMLRLRAGQDLDQIRLEAGRRSG